MPSRLLEREIRKRLRVLDYRAPETVGAKATRGFRLKDLVVDGDADLFVTGRNAFAAKLSKEAYWDSVRLEWTLGTNRIKNQEMALKALLSRETTPAAWILVTCYYSAFFATNELLRVFGRPVLFFTKEHMVSVRQYSAGGGADIEHGNYAGTVHQLDSGEIELRLVKTAEQPHQYAWRSLKAITPPPAGMAGIDAKPHERFHQFLGTASQAWPEPSEVRNRWNYVCPELYGAAGEREARDLVRLAGDDDAAFLWARRARITSDDRHEAAAIAFVRSVLLRTVAALDPVFS